jgi:hypothetical protein
VELTDDQAAAEFLIASQVNECDTGRLDQLGLRLYSEV